MVDRYFQIQLRASSTLAAYQPLCIRGGADAGLDGTILFPAVGERWITLPGDPETLQISLLAADQDPEAPSPVAAVRCDRSKPTVCRIDMTQTSSIKAKACSTSVEDAATSLPVI